MELGPGRVSFNVLGSSAQMDVITKILGTCKQDARLQPRRWLFQQLATRETPSAGSTLLCCQACTPSLFPMLRYALAVFPLLWMRGSKASLRLFLLMMPPAGGVPPCRLHAQLMPNSKKIDGIVRAGPLKYSLSMIVPLTAMLSTFGAVHGHTWVHAALNLLPPQARCHLFVAWSVYLYPYPFGPAQITRCLSVA